MAALHRLLGSAILATALLHRPAQADPRLTIVSQWSAGAEGAAMNAFGDLVTQAGVKWEHNPVSGFTTDMMNKLRADIIAGRPPAASQLKGPEIRSWSAIAPTVNLDNLVSGTDYEKMIPPALAALHKPKGDWIAIPLQIYRVNTLYASKAAMDRIGATALPRNWDEFNAMAEKMEAAGIKTPVMTGGLGWADTMDFELVLAGISADAYKRGIMQLDDATLRGPEVLAAFREVRRLTGWMNPANAGQHWSVFIPAFIKGEYGLMLMHGGASGVLKRANLAEGRDYLCGPTPDNNAKPMFDLNVDSIIFWDTKNPDLLAGQRITAGVAMGKPFNEVFTKLNGSIPVRTDVDLTDAAYQDCQRDAARNLKDALAADTVVLSLGHNMAQTNEVTAALRDVITEFMHNPTITPETAQKRLVEAADAVR